MNNCINDFPLSLEKNILEVIVSTLSNSDNDLNYDKNDDIIEFHDIPISLDLFKNSFFDNNYGFFELNTQYSNYKEFAICDKIIKNSEFKFMKNKKRTNKVMLIDIISNKFICNKKTKINDIKKINFIKDINKYNSLFDFKIHINHLSFDDILSIYNQHPNKNNKHYFRFKIRAIYYSNQLDENVTLSFNFLTKIQNLETLSNDVTDTLTKNNHTYEDNESNESNENIVYSNYKNKLPKNIIGSKENLSYSNYKNYMNENKITKNEQIYLEEDDEEDDENMDNYSYDNSSIGSHVKSDENDDFSRLC
jgi:hypothetical protein